MLTTQRKKEIKHRVLGLSGKETEEEMKFKGFCSLCMRTIPQGGVSIRLIGENGYLFFIHANCIIEQKLRMHKSEFIKDVKSRPKPKKTRRNTKKVHDGDGKTKCCFCKKNIRLDQTYVMDGKRRFHKDGPLCWSRYKRVMDTRRNSITYYSK